MRVVLPPAGWEEIRWGRKRTGNRFPTVPLQNVSQRHEAHPDRPRKGHNVCQMDTVTGFPTTFQNVLCFVTKCNTSELVFWRLIQRGKIL